MNDRRIYRAAYDIGLEKKELDIVTDSRNVVLPERTQVLATETCGKMYMPINARLQPGQIFTILPLDEQKRAQILNPPLYTVKSASDKASIDDFIPEGT